MNEVTSIEDNVQEARETSVANGFEDLQCPITVHEEILPAMNESGPGESDANAGIIIGGNCNEVISDLFFSLSLFFLYIRIF